MNLHAKTLPGLSALALCVISTCLLPACGGGSAGGMVKASPPPPPPPPEKFCPPPLTGDCIVNPPYTLTFEENVMTGGRQSDYALIMRSTSGGWLTLIDENRFSGGTAVEQGTLILGWGSTLISNATVSPTGELWMGGTLRGNLVNSGRVLAGQMQLSPGNWATENLSLIQGNYRQSATGTLAVTLNWPLMVTDQAQLDGGTVELHAEQEWDGSGHVYYFPDTPSSQRLLHAAGGVTGQFDSWTSPGLFIEGRLRYAPNDVYFDLIRISVQGAISAAGNGDAITSGTAKNIDDAFLSADGYATSPRAGLTVAQQQFLQSAASIQSLRNYDQAVATFDSLSGHGHGHVAAVEALLQQASVHGSRLSARLDHLQPGMRAGPWSAPPAMVPMGAGTFTHAKTTGYDQWLSERLLLGGSFGWSQGNLQFDRSGGTAHSQSPQWSLYLRGNGDKGWYAMGELGYGRHQLGLDRSIDLGNQRRNVHSERNLDVTHAYAETGRDLRIGHGRLTPFAAVSHAALRSEGFIEQGSTGFELVAQASRHQRSSADLGFRYARHWRWGGDQWVRLELGAQYQYLLGASDDMHAAFTGTPMTGFDLNGLPLEGHDTWLEMRLTGGGSDRWSWLLGYDNRASNPTVSMGFELGF